MPTTYSDLIADVRKSIAIVSLEEIKRRLDAKKPMVLVDVREKEEFRAGYIPGAISIPRGFLEMQVEQKLPDKNAPIVALLRRRHALGARRQDARRARLHQRRERQPRLRALEGPRLSRWRRRRSSPTRSAIATRATSSCPRSARSGRRSCSQTQGAAARRRRARQPRGALPRGGRRRHARPRRRRHRRRVEPPAPDPPRHVARRHAQGRQRREGASTTSTPT